MTLNKGYEKCAHLYDLFDTKENIEFFYHYASESGEILDIGAGTGRIAIPLAEKGIKVFCIEPSPAMRKEFIRKISKRKKLLANIMLIDSNAISFKLNRTFPAAFLSGCFDHLLDDRERFLALSNIGKHLRPNSKLIFDVFLGMMKDSPLSPSGKVTEGETEYRRYVGGKILSNKKRETILVFEKYIHGKLVDRIEEHSLVGIINRNNIHDLLKKTGFQLTKEFANYDFIRYKQGDPLLIVEAINIKSSPDLEGY